MIFFFVGLSFSNETALADRDSDSYFYLARNTYNSPANISNEKKYRAEETPHPLANIKVKEHIGKNIDLNLSFVNEEGKSLPLKSYFQKQAVLMTVVYYNCPSLCNFHLNGLFKALNNLKNPDYQFVVISMDSTETYSLAKEKKRNYLAEFKNIKAQKVHFLTGSKQSIEKLTNSLGFPFFWDEETEQFAHSPVAYSLSPEGMISRYLYGVEFLSQTLKLAFLEAGKGKTGNIIDRILLFCYRFNPKKNRYSLYAANLMKAGGILIIIALISLLLPTWIKERKGHL
ncbi:MAG: SCO family protein [Bdellovibrionaceae bacterium]|nr:SCO family protein [Pseudobdellovibrionaceae bacterium]